VIENPQQHPAVVLLTLRRMTFRALAAECGLAEDHVRKVLRGQKPASRHFRSTVSRALGVPEAALFLSDEVAVS
jgi:transcriptional regulator with XRE-family HTH domain